MGASVLLVFGVIDQQTAFSAIDFNVIFLLVGLMILVNILKQTGAIDALALITVKTMGGSGLKLMIVFSVMTAVLSAFLDNVTTVLLMTGITCSLSKELGINPVPYLICETIASNIGGAATLIGDPPNIMIGSAAGLSFMDFLFHLGAGNFTDFADLHNDLGLAIPP